MALPKVAIVGRPNVGKSSLLNRFARRRVSIVDPTPGVTRDRVSTVVEIDPPLETPRGTPSRTVEIVDTGGYGVYVAEGRRFDDVGADLTSLTGDIESQIAEAVREADLVLFVVDAQTGLTSLDEMVANLLRRSGAAGKVLLVANKVDSEGWEPYAAEAAGLGLGEPLAVSATTGHHVRDLLGTIWERLPETGEAEDVEPEPELGIAIVGKRNAGKSTLVNSLAGRARTIVSEIAGTTRDAVDVRFQLEGRTFLAIDTAGARKRKSMAEDVEYYAYHRALRSIRRADVAILLIDATVPVSQVDKKLAQELQRQYKPTVIAVNKWDLVPDERASPEAFQEYLTRELKGLDYAPIAFVSAREGRGLKDLIAAAFNLHEQATHREPTAALNRAIEAIMAKRGPSSRLGTQAKLYYASQVDVQPPTIVLMVNDPKLFEGRYERYLLNRMREELPFSEVPIRLIFRARKRAALEEMKHRGRRGERGELPEDEGEPRAEEDEAVEETTG